MAADAAADVCGTTIADVWLAVDEFHKTWFPDEDNPDAVQSFWFAARYPRERKRFRSIYKKFGPAYVVARDSLAAEVAACASGVGTNIESTDPHGDLHFSAVTEPPACNKLVVAQLLDAPYVKQLRLCVFMDQQVRNMWALDQQQPQSSVDSKLISDIDVEESTRICAWLARRLASAVPTVEALITETEATPAQICFFTLALRHTREEQDTRLAQRILEELLELCPALPVVEAFLRENTGALRRMEALAYVKETVLTGEPEVLVRASDVPQQWPPQPYLDTCLSPICLREGAMCNLLSWAKEVSRWEELAAHPLCNELLLKLDARELWDPEAKLVLSYSGGVDSTAHLLLLMAALWRRGRSGAPKMCCLLLSYPNRDEVEVQGEIDWATWTCCVLGIDLFAYKIQLARPHGGGAEDAQAEIAGLTREEYEKHTKEIRFRMYRTLLECGDAGIYGAGPAAVILGHHLDDVDENRLDHLQKGHVLGDVEGMREWREILGAPLLRPLLKHRKCDFQALLDAFPTPFLRDSTPTWSVRGTTRAALDGLEGEQRGCLLQYLDEFGSMAAKVGAQLDSAIVEWAGAGIRRLNLPRGTSGVALDLDALFKHSVSERLSELGVLVDSIREIWNSSVDKLRSGHVLGGNDCVSAVGVIPAHQLADPMWFLFERGFFAAADGLMSKRAGHFHTSQGVSVNKRAVRHLYDNLRSCAKPQFSGGLTQELGYVHIARPPRRILVLYDAAAHPGVDFKAMRASLIEAASRV